ncbi:MAG TPA: 50S ribosomal protein L31e [Nitrososphaera sp.]|nr:50S ribosomal protein L31e [Nitrososphaera sp.]
MATVENLTRVYTINLGRAWLTPQHKRTDRVVNMIREFAQKHMKSDEIKLEQDLNHQIWSRGKTNPPRKVRVKMIKDEDGVVTVSLYEDTAASAEAPAAAEEKEAEPASTATVTQAAEETKPEEKPATADK